jgi:hypothetical protein
VRSCFTAASTRRCANAVWSRLGMRPALGAKDPDTASLLNNLGIVGKHTGDFDDVQRYYSRALSIVEATAGSDDLQAAGLHHNLGGLRIRAANMRRVCRTPDGRSRSGRRRSGPAHPDVAADKGALAAILQAGRA